MSEREAVRREREAFVRGAEWAYPATGTWTTASKAEEAFPLPTITRPRVVTDPHDAAVRWSVGGSSRRIRREKVSALGHWISADAEHTPITNERVALWADLLANPSESVPDDGGDE